MLMSMICAPALDLLARDLDGGGVVALEDQLLEARRAGDVGPLADVDEGGALYAVFATSDIT